jgi:dinuclear metal center YbgI/SA1388 family protein
MMLCSAIIEKLNRLAPPELACEWDNPGLQAGRAGKEVSKILVALDATDEVVEQAVREGADMIVTHHPLIFKPLKKVNDQDFISRRIVRMIQNDISYFAMHTNFDIAPGCMADLAAEQLGLVPEEPLEITGEVNGEKVGIGKIGTLSTGKASCKDPEADQNPVLRVMEHYMQSSDAMSMTVSEIAALVKDRFDLPYVTIYGSEQVTGPVTRIALSPGSGGSMVREAIAKHAEVLITGDIGHHDGIDAAANHLAVIDAGHYGIEQIFIPFMRNYLQNLPGADFEVIEAEPAFPSKVIV